MPPITIYLGNKNYSSWSLRAWLALKSTGAEFREEVFDLAEEGVRDAIRRHSPAGKVPALRRGDLLVWDSLAICEYLAEAYPAAALWPADPAARAVARSASAEMHSSFLALRRHMPMNVRRSSPGKGRAPGVQQNIDRIVAVWHGCRSRFGRGGDFLFGTWTIADCMFAPVATRFRTYHVELDDGARRYCDAVLAHPHVTDWCAAAERETSVNPAYDL